MEPRAPSPETIRIGALADATGASVQAIRYYERQGLIKPAGRRASGYRQFGSDAVDAVRFIRHAQQMGFKLDEIGELLRLRRRVASPGSKGKDAVRAAVETKRKDVAQRIQHLEAVRETLDGLLSVCDAMCSGTTRPEECPIFEAIDHADPPGSIAPAGRAGGKGGRARSAPHHPQP
jgi:DNA-binding transcriptional MerR regulator